MVKKLHETQESTRKRIQKSKQDESQQRRLDRLEKEVEGLKRQNQKLKEEVEELREQKKEVDRAREIERLMVTEEMLTNTDDYKDFETIENMSWPKEIFRTAFIVSGSPLKANKETDLVVLVEEGLGRKENEGVHNTLMDRFPELEDIEDKVGAIAVITRAVNRGGKTTERER